MSEPVEVRIVSVVTQRHYGGFSWAMWWCGWSTLTMSLMFLPLPWMIRSYRQRTAKLISRSL